MYPNERRLHFLFTTALKEEMTLSVEQNVQNSKFSTHKGTIRNTMQLKPFDFILVKLLIKAR